ncbi:MAG: ATP-dependent Clp protease adapter ClpS [Chthoniobacterales bacterium]
MSSQAGSRETDGRLTSSSRVLAVFEFATAAPTVERETREKQQLDVPWQVVVHNDPINLMSYVTMVFQKVFGFTREKAEKHMLEVHQQGRSILWSGLRERAELYVQQLHGYLLLATIERVN